MVEAVRANGQKLAVDVLQEFMTLFAGLAAHHQPLPPGMPVPLGRVPDEGKFEKWARLTVETAADLAPFQSPKYAAIRLHTVPNPGMPGATPLAEPVMPGDDAKLVEGRVARIDDPIVLQRTYREIMIRPKGN